MAEFLVKAVSASSSNTVKDTKGCYKRGDVVCVMPDGHKWGAKELLAPASGGLFVVVKVNGVDYRKARKYLTTGQLTRAKYRFQLDSLPTGVRNALRNSGEYTTTWNTIRSILLDNDTGVTESNSPAS